MSFPLTRFSFISLITCSILECQAQELAPRAYWPAPEGTSVLVASYQYSEGDVLVDASAPVEGAKAKLDFLSLTWQHTFDMLGRTGNLQLNAPYVRGEAQGTVNGQFRERSITALADARARLAINLAGAPTMDAGDFRALVADPEPIVGASLLLSIPTGDYDGNRLFNAGTNRWAVKPAIGFIIPMTNRWLFEGELGVWLYGDNDDFFGQTREQDPVSSSELHLVHVMPSGIWLSFDINWYEGGNVSVGDGPEQSRLENSRAGLTFLYPFNRSHAVRASVSSGIESKIAGDFDSVSLSYMYIW